MASSNRLYLDKAGKMFVPMNVEGGTWDEHFITTPKMACIVGIFASAIIIAASLKESYAPFTSYIILYAIWAIVSILVLRFIVFEERYYYKMYQQLKESEISTPSVFWDIASIKDTNDGAILTYSDTKIGVLIRLERDTITGKPPEFKEMHYDAISDFYKEIMLSKYNFVQLNIMEQAGNDPRLEELDKLIYTSDNPNVRELMERQIGYIKNITHHTLYESEYILFYTTDLSKMDSIITDSINMVYKILDGAYIGYRVLRGRDIVEFMKEEYGVKYFNYTEATLTMFKKYGIHTKSPFDLTKIVYTDGDIQNVTKMDKNKINKLASDVLNGVVDLASISLKDTLYPKEKQNRKKKVDYDSLSEGFTQKKKPTTGVKLRTPIQGKRPIGKGKKEAKTDEKLFDSSPTLEIDSSDDDNEFIDF